MPTNDKEYMRKYRQKNREKINKYYREYYREHETKRKTDMISKWRTRGVIESPQYTFDELYEAYRYCGYCEECGKQFPDTYDRCLDHDHETGLFRDILCRVCNVKRG